MRNAAKRIGVDPRALYGLAIIVVGLLVWGFAFAGGFSTVFGSPTRTVRANFNSIEDIVPNDPVRVDGVQVGSVASVLPDPEGNGGTLVMNVDTSQPIYRDAGANILWRTVLGANDAVAIDPGTRAAGALPSNATLPTSADTNQVELDQVTLAFQGGAQSGLQTMIKQLGPAFDDAPALGNGLSALSQVAPSVTTGVGALRGEVQDTDLRNLVIQASRATTALSVGTDADTTQQFVQTAAQTLDATGANPAALQGSIQGFDAVLSTGEHRVFTEYDSLLGALQPLVHKLNGSVGQLSPALRKLHPTLINASRLLTAVQPLLQKLDPDVAKLSQVAGTGVPIINQLYPGLNEANQDLAGLYEKYPTGGGRPVYDFIGGPIETFGALTGYYDEDGQIATLALGLEDPEATQALPCNLDFTGEDLLVCESISDSFQDFLSGGSSLLQSLDKKDGSGQYGKILQDTLSLESGMDSVRSEIASKFPAAADILYKGVPK